MPIDATDMEAPAVAPAPVNPQPALPLPGRADFMPNMPAPELQRSWAEPQGPATGGPNAKDLAAAQHAVMQAMKFQGLRSYQEDLAMGMPPEQALLKNGHKMFPDNPAQFVHALTQAKPKMPMTGPVQTSPALDENQMPIKGTHIVRTATGGFHIIHDAPSMEDKQAKVGQTFDLHQLNVDLIAAKKRMASEDIGSARYNAAKKEVGDIKAQADSVLGRSKSSKLLRYNPDKDALE